MRGTRADTPLDGSAPFGPGRPATERARHRSVTRAYAEGKAGKPMSVDTSDPMSADELREFYEQGRQYRLDREPSSGPSDDASPPAPIDAPAAPPSPTSPPPPVRSSSGPSSSSINEGAGVVLGLVIYTLLLNYLQGGTAQARGWLAAKFTNKPYTGARFTPSAPARPTASTAKPATPATAVHLVTVPGR